MDDQPTLYALKEPGGSIEWWSIQNEEGLVDVTPKELSAGYTVVRVKVVEVQDEPETEPGT